MAGWRIGFALGHKELITPLSNYIKTFVGGTFGAVQDAVADQLNQTQEERQKLRNRYTERRQLVLEALASTLLRAFSSEGIFFIWARLPESWDDKRFVEEFLVTKGLALLPGTTFGPSGKGYVRISLVSDIPILKEGMKRLQEFLEAKSNDNRKYGHC